MDESRFQPDYEGDRDDREVVVAQPKRARLQCKAEGCSYNRSSRELEDHWRNLHDPNVILYMCPLPRCGAKVRELYHRESHWKRFHNLSRKQCRQLAMLPAVAEIKPNRFFQSPGSAVALVPPVRLPVGALPYRQRSAVQQQVQEVIQPASQVSAPLPELLPPPPPSPPPVPSAAPLPEPPPSTDCSFLSELLEVEVFENTSTQPWCVEGTTATTTTTPTTSITTASSTQPQSTSTEEELEAVESEMARLREKRRRLQLQSTMELLQQLATAERERDEAQRRVRLLEEHLRQAQQQETPARGHTVADLERLPLTRGLLLFPCIQRGQPSVTSVYGLSSADLAQLQLGNRDPMLSFEAI